MDKRYRVYVNGEWYASEDDYDSACSIAYAMSAGDEYYGEYVDVVVYDTYTRRVVY